MCSATTHKYVYQIPSSPQNMYVRSNELTRNYTTSASSGKQPFVQTFVLIFSVLLCISSCFLTITLSYQWHNEAIQKIDLLINAVNKVGKDLTTCTEMVKTELETKRLLENKEQNPMNSDEEINNYDEMDDEPKDQFMGRDLLDNIKPVRTYDTTNSQTKLNKRKRRKAEIVTHLTKNELNSSTFENPNMPLVQEEIVEENTVKNISRKPKKLMIEKKKQEEKVLLEDFKETPEITAAHFTSNASNYNIKTHPFYYGNGRMEHPNGDYRDWTPNYWDLNQNGQNDINLNHNGNHFIMKDGTVEINKPGLYFVYAQIHYSDSHDMNGFSIKKNDENVLRCTVTRHTSTHTDSCYIGGLIYFNTKDVLSVKGLDKKRNIILEPTRSFFGLYKISNDYKK